MEAQQEACKQEDGILIEKDGQFELLSISDMQAQAKLDRAQVQEEELQGNKNEKLADKQNESVLKDAEANERDSPDKDMSASAEIDELPIKTEVNVKSESMVKFPAEELMSHPQNVTNTAITTSSALSAKHNKPSNIRTKSAPGFRLGYMESDDESLKREKNEAAFRAWLEKKNKELHQKRQTQQSQIKQTEVELREKQERNKIAYQAWLECKKQEYLEQKAKEKATRPVTSITRDEEEQKRAAFENWLSKKQEEKQKENDNRLKMKQEEEVAAKRADPMIVAEAYKRCVCVCVCSCQVTCLQCSWLHRKRVQARDEAIKKEKYRKKYFQQSRQLKESATLRFASTCIHTQLACLPMFNTDLKDSNQK